MSESHMPWESLKAETLRSIHRDLGLPFTGKRDDMVERLKEIEVNGLETASEEDAPEPMPPRVRRKSDRALATEEPSLQGSPSRLSGRKPTRQNGAEVAAPAARTSRKRGAAKAVFDGVDVPATRLKRRSLGRDADGVKTRGTKQGVRTRRGKARA
ncbi:hypothetical protein CERSUDRAFT_115833 [Gelatoporia subvermispora B]|uniref:SAP domain-containing protein n=1 Tax=Ceriporiopsis subvermispora (strain B) TaxID=914234 RepID=M2QV49_CERS8|nr:hypothetical protein CERSUDRAFT_115833 [Gelatoporia subvermispora B]